MANISIGNIALEESLSQSSMARVTGGGGWCGVEEDGTQWCMTFTKDGVQVSEYKDGVVTTESYPVGNPLDGNDDKERDPK